MRCHPEKDQPRILRTGIHIPNSMRIRNCEKSLEFPSLHPNDTIFLAFDDDVSAITPGAPKPTFQVEEFWPAASLNSALHFILVRIRREIQPSGRFQPTLNLDDALEAQKLDRLSSSHTCTLHSAEPLGRDSCAVSSPQGRLEAEGWLGPAAPDLATARSTSVSVLVSVALATGRPRRPPTARFTLRHTPTDTPETLTSDLESGLG